jgi:hypothetical protein
LAPARRTAAAAHLLLVLGGARAAMTITVAADPTSPTVMTVGSAERPVRA